MLLQKLSIFKVCLKYTWVILPKYAWSTLQISITIQVCFKYPAIILQVYFKCTSSIFIRHHTLSIFKYTLSIFQLHFKYTPSILQSIQLKRKKYTSGDITLRWINLRKKFGWWNFNARSYIAMDQIFAGNIKINKNWNITATLLYYPEKYQVRPWVCIFNQWSGGLTYNLLAEVSIFNQTWCPTFLSYLRK